MMGCSEWGRGGGLYSLGRGVQLIDHLWSDFVSLFQMLLTSSCRVQQPPAPPDTPHQTQTHLSLTSQTPEAPTLTKGTAISLLGLAQWNAGIRPRPVRPSLPRLSSEGLRASQRSHRSAPSKSVPLLCCFELI